MIDKTRISGSKIPDQMLFFKIKLG